MRFKYTLNIFLFSLLAVIALVSGDTEEENQLVIKAEKAFVEKNYEQSTSLFSQLLSSYPKNPNYNYKYGASLLYSSPDKANALRYLQYAVTNNERDSLSLYYLAKAYHLNFYFDDAIDYYQKFNNKLPNKYKSEYNVNELVTQCKFAKEIIEDIQLIKVLERRTVKNNDFFRSYRLGSLDRKIIIVPDEFRSSKDKKLEHQSLIVHNPMNNEIYFSSYGKKGDKGKDIYKVLRYPNGNFSAPINLGLNINTAADEDYPYLHPSGKILYFASKGHNSIGGYDIFKSDLNTETNTWGKAENLGFTINSPEDDFLYISDRQQDIAYFSSTRNNKLGELTLFKILPQQGNNAVILVQGSVKTKQGIIPSNPIIIKNLNTGELIGEFLPNPKSGDFIATLPHLNKYSLEINHIGEVTSSVLNLPNANGNKIVAHEIIIDDVTGTIEISENKMLKAKKEEVAVVYRRAASMQNLYGKDVEFDNPKALAQVREEVNLPPRDISAGFKKDDSKFKNQNNKRAGLEEIKTQQEQLNTQINAAYLIAANEQKKSETLKYKKVEIEKKLSEAKTEKEKSEINEELIVIENKISQSNTEASKALKIAKQKEQLVEKSIEQERVTEKYLEALEKAEKSGNSDQAVLELEKVMKQLDLAKVDFEKQEEKVNQIFEKEIEEKRAELIQQDFKVNKLEMELEALEEERMSLENQMLQTKNKALIDELKLQQKELVVKINETNAELKKVQMIKALYVSEVNALESGELVAEEDLIANLMDNNYSEKDKKALEEQLDEVKASKQTAAYKEDKNEIPSVALENKQVSANLQVNTKPIDKPNEKIVETSNDEQKNTEAVTPVVASYQRYAEEAEKELQRLQAIQNQKTELQQSMNNREVSSVEIAQKLKELNEEEKQVNARLQKLQAAFVAPQNLSEQEQKEIDEIEEKQLFAQQNQIEIKLNTHKNFVENVEKKMLVNEELASGEGIFIHAEMNDKIKEIEKLNAQQPKTNEDKKVLNNRVNGLQNELDVLQNELMNIIAESEQNKITQVTSLNPIGKSNLDTLTPSNLNEVSTNQTLKFNAQNPSVSSLVQANQNLGTELDLNFNYGIAPEVKRALAEAEQKNISAAKKYYEADSLKNSLGKNPKNDKKIKKRIYKLLSEAKKEQIAIQESYARANKNENLSLINQVQYSIEEGFIANQHLDSVVKIQKTAANKMEQANEIRKKAVKVKKLEEKQSLNNQAYQLEIQALALQNVVVQGELDEEKPEDEVVSYVVKTNSTQPKNNEYNLKADELRAQAQNEGNPGERMRLLNLARQYELASDDDRTKRMVEEIKIVKNQFEVRKDLVDKVQQNSNQNLKANEAYQYQQEGEKKYDSGVQLLQKSQLEEDKIKQLEWINQAKELFSEASNLQNQAIQNYQESSNEADDPSVVLAFTKKSISKNTNEQQLAVNSLSTINDQSHANSFSKQNLEVKPEKDQKIISNNTPTQNEINDPLGKQNVTELPMEDLEESPDEILKAYTAVLDEAKAIEKNEASRVDEIIRLLDEARKKNLEYEKMLADMQNIKDDKVLEEMFVEANALREESEKLELQAKKEEEYLKNNMAEAQSKRMEASLIQEAMDEQTKMLAKQKDQESQKELSKINEFAGGDNSKSQNNKVSNSNADYLSQSSSNPKESNSTVKLNNDKPGVKNLLLDYQDKLAEVIRIEKKEAERLDKLMTLRNQSNKKKEQYESLLQQVEGITDPSKVQAQISKAELIREEVEKLDVEIKNEEEFMRNNMAEAKAKRKEAGFLLDVMDVESKKVALEEEKKSIENKEKVENYMAKQTVVLTGDKGIQVSGNGSNLYRSNPQNIANENGSLISSLQDLEDKGILGGLSYSDQKPADVFTFNGPITKEIEIDPPMPAGLFYKVQVGAFKNKINPAVFQGISPINGESTNFGLIRVTAGMFRGYKAANMAKGRIRNIGFRDAFVVAFYNGKRISLAEAEQLLAQANESDQFVYENIVADEVNKLKSLGIQESEADALTLISQQESKVVRNSSSTTLAVNPNATLSNNSTPVVNSTSKSSISLNNRNDLFYTVQIGAFGAPRTSQQLYNIDPLYSYVTSSGLIKYSTGVFLTYSEANSRKNEVLGFGPKDAYVVAYQNGQTVPVQKVREITDTGTKSVSVNSNLEENSISNSFNQNNEIFYRVQVGAYKAPINPKTTPYIKELENYGVQYTTTATGLLIYTIGNVKTKAEADELNAKAKAVGLKDAFVVAFKAGKRISIQEALNNNK